MTAAFDALLAVYTQTKIIYRFVNFLIYDLFLMLVFEKIVYLEVWFNFCDLLCSAWKFEVVSILPNFDLAFLFDSQYPNLEKTTT
jgi:hypothetical protein